MQLQRGFRKRELRARQVPAMSVREGAWQGRVLVYRAVIFSAGELLAAGSFSRESLLIWSI